MLMFKMNGKRNVFLYVIPKTFWWDSDIHNELESRSLVYSNTVTFKFQRINFVLEVWS